MSDRCCKPNEHDWERMRGGRERCRKCSTTYPCLLDCQHYDCRIDKGQKLPEGVTYLGTFQRGEIV